MHFVRMHLSTYIIRDTSFSPRGLVIHLTLAMLALSHFPTGMVVWSKFFYLMRRLCLGMSLLVHRGHGTLRVGEEDVLVVREMPIVRIVVALDGGRFRNLTRF